MTKQKCLCPLQGTNQEISTHLCFRSRHRTWRGRQIPGRQCACPTPECPEEWVWGSEAGAWNPGGHAGRQNSRPMGEAGLRLEPHGDGLGGGKEELEESVPPRSLEQQGHGALTSDSGAHSAQRKWKRKGSARGLLAVQPRAPPALQQHRDFWGTTMAGGMERKGKEADKNNKGY